MKVSVVFRTKLMAFFENPPKEFGELPLHQSVCAASRACFPGGVRPFWAFAGHGPRERGKLPHPVDEVRRHHPVCPIRAVVSAHEFGAVFLEPSFLHRFADVIHQADHEVQVVHRA